MLENPLSKNQWKKMIHKIGVMSLYEMGLFPLCKMYSCWCLLAHLAKGNVRPPLKYCLFGIADPHYQQVGM
jgi:hypothetical protein